MRIGKSCVVLYDSTSDYISIRITQTKNKGITTSWYYNKPAYEENRNILNELKSNGCSICGYNKSFNALDFHHVNPSDKCFAISCSSMGKPTKELVDELQKCILLCKNCHYEIHEGDCY